MKESLEDAAQGNTEAEDTDAAEDAEASEGAKAEGDEQNKADSKEDGAEGKENEAKSDVPEKYDLKLPDDSLLDESAIERISAYAREKGLSNEAAQELVEMEHQAMASYAEAQKQIVEEAREEWAKASEKDKEIGGKNFSENVELARRAVERFGSEEFKKALDETGFGNHPEVLRVFVRIGKAMSEDKLVNPDAQQAGGKKSPEEILYGETAKK